METIFSAYTKEINNQTFYFVKKFNSFPEYDDVPKVLVAYGMHTDFYHACDIAKIYDEAVINNLLDELHILPASAKIIPLQKQKSKSLTNSIIRNTHQALLKLRLAGINN